MSKITEERQKAGGRKYIFCPLPQGVAPLNLFMQVQTIQAQNITLRDLIAKFGLQFVREPKFFPE